MVAIGLKLRPPLCKSADLPGNATHGRIQGFHHGRRLQIVPSTGEVDLMELGQNGQTIGIVIANVLYHEAEVEEVVMGMQLLVT